MSWVSGDVVHQSPGTFACRVFFFITPQFCGFFCRSNVCVSKQKPNSVEINQVQEEIVLLSGCLSLGTVCFLLIFL